ncbi:hypothetical protein [Natranaeroarchaeum aerophilus]|uniref:Uncharacterized protein n=1 Tax=Natranaeroarchaeum aerophilus TaxID=2917711 RepID=A0AAE3FQ01_9EURY|nr:hypothetical protein [Natranaeroarchaeum aerophilus]MCL9813129.1 hypothetical protein [Natranaeroarchaeum aerophilus]
MAARPPSNGSEEPDAIEFGIAAVDARLGETDLTFPATDDEIVDAIRNDSIPFNSHGFTVDLRTALEETGRSEFDSEQDLLNALYPVFEERRNSTSVGLLAQIRDMLPF